MTGAKLALGGLYAITDAGLIGGARLLPAAEAALRGGVGMLQYRDKGNDHARRKAEAGALLELCRDYGVPLIINDDLELTAALGADGLHLGQEDVSPIRARERLGSKTIIGISAYNNAQAALAAEADYIAFGRLFASRTKPTANPATLDVFAQARRLTQRPLVGIGGINTDNAAQVIEAGADWLAVVDAVFGATDIEAATRRLCQRITQAI